ncbi:MAG: hypothetical protein GC192_08300 [Bacteroidetes bacterium]|nr:hypothetical protein [Bacteroidota bacterium]
MKQKLISLFNQLSGVEKREFTRFIESDYFNRREEPVQLWHYLLREFAPAGKTWQPAHAFQALFPNQPHDEAKLRYPASWLTKHIEYFLAMRRFEKNETEQALQLAVSFRERNLEEHFGQAVRMAETALEKRVRDQAWYHDHYRLEFEKYALIESQRRTAANNLPAVGKALDTYLIAAKLRQSCIQLAHQSVFQTKYDYTFLPPLLEYLEGSQFLEIPAIALYYHCYKALTEGDEAQFRKFRALLEEHFESFSQNEIRDLWLLAINFCIKLLNTGSRPFGEEALSLYQTGIERQIILENGVLGRFAYKNTVALALLYGQYEWVKGFINRYRTALEPAWQEDFYHYNLARYHFTIKEYGKAMELLAKVDDRDLLLNLDGKLMLLKMYYELGEFNALDSLLSSMKTFIRRKKELAYHQSHYLGIIRFTQKLMALRPGDLVAASALRKEIEAAEGLPEKDWLLAKLD